jgi:hypothetical protein
MILTLYIHDYPFSLKLHVSEDETLLDVFQRFNKYRAPAKQIHKVYSAASELINLDQVIRDDITVWTKSYLPNLS